MPTSSPCPSSTGAAVTLLLASRAAACSTWSSARTVSTGRVITSAACISGTAFLAVVLSRRYDQVAGGPRVVGPCPWGRMGASSPGSPEPRRGGGGSECEEFVDWGSHAGDLLGRAPL